MGSSAAVANMINNLMTGVVALSPCYDKIGKDLNEYYDNSWNRTKATLKHCSVENAGLLCLKLQPNGKAISSTPGLSPSRKCFMSTYSLKTTWHSQQIKVDCNVVRPGKVLNWIIIVTEGCCKLRTAPYSLVASRLNI
ncbi:Protein of unknown function DUF247 [Theobroma cacao]|nr:Protein of unknown function DUF247 [Theobroma cacao]